jgi:AcrR family transcriptional regulator
MPAAEATPDPKPSRASGLLALVRALIDYGRHLATTFRSNPHPFGAADIALILARITSGLLRAEALEARIIRNAARLDTPPTPPRATSHRQSPPAPAAAARDALVPGLDPGICLPTPEQIAAEIRRRPIGAVIADICRDLGIMANHPLWRELSAVIIRYGGNLARLVKDICERAFQRSASPWPLTPPLAPALQSPAPSSTGPP